MRRVEELDFESGVTQSGAEFVGAEMMRVGPVNVMQATPENGRILEGIVGNIQLPRREERIVDLLENVEYLMGIIQEFETADGVERILLEGDSLTDTADQFRRVLSEQVSDTMV